MKINRKYNRKQELSVREMADGIMAENKIILSQAITLLESTKVEHNNKAREILEMVLNNDIDSTRIGITGVPGVGKSTFIEALGKEILQENSKNKIAVLAIDPSSLKNKGSIMGDKTRMDDISNHPNVFVRPSAAGQELGGVHRKTRETILLCEAAGYNYIIIETVGVGQSEIAVHSMVDCFLLLMLPGAGDELQGIKRGIMEMANIVAINKVDDDKNVLARQAKLNYRNALHLLPHSATGWITPVETCSGLTHKNINLIFKKIVEFKRHQVLKNHWQKNRNIQSKYWIKETINQYLLNNFYNNIEVQNQLVILENEVYIGKISAFTAADKLINLFQNLKK